MKEAEFIDILRAGLDSAADLYTPLRFEDVSFEDRVALADNRSRVADARCAVVWGGKQVDAVLEVKVPATPRRVVDTLARLEQGWPEELGAAVPILAVPYLSSGIVEQLQQRRISGIDLSGNYIILTDELVALRLDQPNAYPQSRDIKKVYSYNSSIVGRCLLVEPRVFEQVNEIYEAIQARGAGVSLSTVSKVLKQLDEEMIISKTRGAVRLLQPDKLLECLRGGYRPPRTGRRLELKLPDGEEDAILTEALGPQRWVWSGEASAQAYASTTPPQVRIAYTPRLAGAMEALGSFESRRFYNCIVEQTDDDYPYFDRRGRWASPVEAYLALSRMDKREREVARSIRENVIMKKWRDDV